MKEIDLLKIKCDIYNHYLSVRINENDNIKNHITYKIDYHINSLFFKLNSINKTIKIRVDELLPIKSFIHDQNHKIKMLYDIDEYMFDITINPNYILKTQILK